MKTYSLAEVADIALPSDMKNPERWLREQLNRKVLRGYRVGQAWRMTHDQLVWNIDRLSNGAQEPGAEAVEDQSEPVSILSGMSERARARIQRQADRRLA